MNDLKSQKHLFHLPDNVHYLNCAFKAPLLKASEEACIQALKRERTPYSIKPDDFFREIEQVKASFAQIVHSTHESIAIIPSVSYGMASVLNNTSPKPGGTAITVKDEFPSGYFALEKWCKDHGNELVAVGPNEAELIGESWNRNLLEQIDDQTSVVLMSSVHWMNGIKFDLKAIGERCRSVGAAFIVDGTQSVGALPIDVEGCHIDALICAGYKWLFGPYSLGLMYVSDRFADGVPIEESWMNRSNAMEFSSLTNYDDQYQSKAARFNVGETSNFTLMPMLNAALKQVVEWNPERIQDYCGELIQPLLAYLETLNVKLEEPAFFCNHLFALKLPPDLDLQQLKANLEANNIYLSTRGSYLRLAVHLFNDAEDIQRLISVISASVEHSKS